MPGRLHGLILRVFALHIANHSTETTMRTAAIALAIIGLALAPITCPAGVAPSHDASQLSQSGAKIAPPQKNTEPARKDEKEKEPEKDPKR